MRHGTSDAVDFLNSVLLSPRQKQILAALQPAPTMAALYEAAAWMSNSPGFPARQYFIGHAMREILSWLPHVLDSVPRPVPISYPRAIDRFAQSWKLGVRPLLQRLADDTPRAASPVSIEPSLAQHVDVLVEEHDQIPSNRAQYFTDWLALRYPPHLLLTIERTVRSLVDLPGAELAHVRALATPEEPALRAWEEFENLIFNIIVPAHLVTAAMDEDLAEFNNA